MSRSNSASEAVFQVDPRPEDYSLTGSLWIEEYIDDIRTVAVRRVNSGHVDYEDDTPTPWGNTTYQPFNFFRLDFKCNCSVEVLMQVKFVEAKR
ncbi:hypothetical protein TNCV_1556941 [Trichonephila clavipes]|nr:hypothetical protein TNCV_1556941 [Trichonephila clavipes]